MSALSARVSLPRSSYSWGDAGPVPGQKSRAKDVAQGFSSDGFRDFFVVSFARWLQLTFRNTEEVAATFGVRHQTAVNWWNAQNCASGDTIGAQFMGYPAAQAWFLAEWREAQE